MKNYNSGNALKLEGAFLELLLEMKYSQIKVSHITQKAKVNRTSFYILWSDKDELLEFICANFLSTFSDKMFQHFQERDEKKRNKLLQEAFRDITRNENIIRGIWAVTDAPFSPYIKMQEAMEKTVYMSISVRYPEYKKENNKILYSKYFSACALATIKWWLDNSKERNYEYIADVILVTSAGFIDLLKME